MKKVLVFAIVAGVMWISSADVAATVLIPQDGWTCLFCDSEETNKPPENSFDGDPCTVWHTKWDGADPPHPHWIMIDLDGVYDISGFRYLPRQDDNENGMIKGYEFYVSDVYVGNNPCDWGAAVASGTFANDQTEKTVSSDRVLGRYICLKALSEINGGPWTSMAELNVLAVPPDVDINNDGKVNIEDFAILATWWDDEDGCLSSDWCESADFDMSGTVDFTDLTCFVENWLRQPEKFSFIFISDTQTYTDQVHGGTWEMFHDMMPWIAAKKDELNIKFVGHVGDVQIQDLYSDARVQNTRNEFNIVGNASIPYAISLGNHDGCEFVGSGPTLTEK